MTPSEELLSAYLDDELSPQERVDVDRRLASDSQWRETLEKLQEVRGWVQELPTVAPGRPKSIMQMLAEEKNNSEDDGVRLANHTQYSSSPSSWKWMMSLAAAGLALIGTTLWWLSEQSQQVALGSKIDNAVTDSPMNPASPPAPMGRGRVAEGNSSLPADEIESAIEGASGNLATKGSPTAAEAPSMKAAAAMADSQLGGTGGFGGGGVGSMPAPGGIAMEAGETADAAFAPAGVADPSAVPDASNPRTPSPKAPGPKAPSPKAMASNAGIGGNPRARTEESGSRGGADVTRSTKRDNSQSGNADEANAVNEYFAFQRFYTEQLDEAKNSSYFLVKPTVETEALPTSLGPDKPQGNQYSEELRRAEPTESPSAIGDAALSERGASLDAPAVPGSNAAQKDEEQAQADSEVFLQEVETGITGTLVAIPAIHLKVPVEVFMDLEESASKSDWKLHPTNERPKTLETLATPQDSNPLDPASEKSIERFSKAGENVWLLKISREQYEALRARWSEKRLDVSEVLDDRKLQLVQSAVAPKNPSRTGGSPTDSVADESRKDLSTNSANQGSEARSEGQADFIFIILQQR